MSPFTNPLLRELVRLLTASPKGTLTRQQIPQRLHPAIPVGKKLRLLNADMWDDVSLRSEGWMEAASVEEANDQKPKADTGAASAGSQERRAADRNVNHVKREIGRHETRCTAG